MCEAKKASTKEPAAEIQIKSKLTKPKVLQNYVKQYLGVKYHAALNSTKYTLKQET